MVKKKCKTENIDDVFEYLKKMELSVYYNKPVPDMNEFDIGSGSPE